MTVVLLLVVVFERHEVPPFRLAELTGDHIAVEDAQVELPFLVLGQRTVVIVVAGEVEPVSDGVVGHGTIVVAAVHFLPHHQRVFSGLAFQQGGVEVQIRLFVPGVDPATTSTFAACTGEDQELFHDTWSEVRFRGIKR